MQLGWFYTLIMTTNRLLDNPSSVIAVVNWLTVQCPEAVVYSWPADSRTKGNAKGVTLSGRQVEPASVQRLHGKRGTQRECE
jgi:hypothetical protein